MDVGAVAGAVHRAAGDADPVEYVLGRLRDCKGALAVALGGEALQVELVLLGEIEGDTATHLLVFTPDGATFRVRPSGALASGFRPHFTVRGRGLEVVALVLGDIDVARAVYRGLLELHVMPDELVPRYPRFMRVLAGHLLDLADQPQPGPPAAPSRGAG